MQRAELLEKTDYGKDWRQEEKGTIEDKMVGWYHWLNGHEFEQAPGTGDGQGSLACCSPCGLRESDITEQPNNNSNVFWEFKLRLALKFLVFLFFLKSSDLHFYEAPSGLPSEHNGALQLKVGDSCPLPTQSLGPSPTLRLQREGLWLPLISLGELGCLLTASVLSVSFSWPPGQHRFSLGVVVMAK